MRKPPLTFLLASLLLDCATLDALPRGTCGNGVVDADEDCDSFPEGCGRPADGARACRLTCDRRQAGSCPAGWGCSVDGFCRQATGEFGAASAPASAGVITLLAGDFDGDGRTDVFGGGPRLGTSRPRVHFYDSNAVMAAPITLQVPVASPVIRDFDGDGRADLAFAINDGGFGGFGLLSGTADRAFSPVLFPMIVRPATDMRFVTIPLERERFVPPNGQAAAITLERTPDGTFFRSVSAGKILGLTELERPASMGPEQVVGSLIHGSVFSPSAFTPPSACGDVLIPYNDGEIGHLAILSPCASVTQGGASASEWASARPPKDVTLPAKVTGKTVLVNLPGAPPTISVQTQQGTYVAESDGLSLGAFARAKADAGGAAESPIAVGVLDASGTLGVALPQGFYVGSVTAADAGAPDSGTAGPEPRFGKDAAMRPMTGLWSDVRIGNFNGDDLLDVVAISPGALELEVFTNAGAAGFTRSYVSSSQPVRAMTTGDFDGDRIADVAFLASARELGDEEGAEVEALVAYGRASGGPEPARVIGRFARATAITPIHEYDKSIDDLVVVERRPVKGSLPTTSIALLVNSSDRQSLAPLGFSEALAKAPPPANTFRSWMPVSIVAAPLLAAGTIDVMAIAAGITVRTDAKRGESPFLLPFPTGAWLAKGNEQAEGRLDAFAEKTRFDERFVNALDGERFAKEGVLENLLVSATADVDDPPDGVEEIVSLSRRGPSATDLLVVRAAELDRGRPQQLALEDFAVTGADELALFDLDADGLPDAVVLTRGRGRARLRVYRHDGKGSFDPRPAVLDLAASAAGGEVDPERDAPVGFARVATGRAESGRPRAELAVVTKARLVLARLVPDQRRLEVRDLTELLGAPLSGGLTSVAAGDFDGDGVEDLAVADSGAIRLVRQQPRLR